jgi:hypothetical protein
MGASAAMRAAWHAEVGMIAGRALFFLVRAPS